MVLGEVTSYCFGKMAEGSADFYVCRFFIMGIFVLLGALFRNLLQAGKGCFLYPKENSEQEKPGESVRKHGFLIVILFFILIGFFKMEEAKKTDPVTRVLQDITQQGEKKRGMLKGCLSSIREKDGKWTFILKPAVLVLDGEQYHTPAVMIKAENLSWEEQTVLPGMTMKAEGLLNLFQETRNPGEFDYRLYYRSKKMQFYMKTEQVQVVEEKQIPLQSLLHEMRRSIRNAIEILYGEEDRGIYQAILLGDQSGLMPEVRQLYQKSGIAHLLAVSGLHVSLIGMGVYRVFRRFGAGYGSSGLLCEGILIFYGCLTGFSPSVFRAIFMTGCLFLGSYFGRTYDVLSAAFLSLFLLIWDSPLLLFTSGFQLSFGAVIAIGFGNEAFKKVKANNETWCFGIKKRCLEGIGISWSIQMVTGPIILYHFYEFPVYSVILNLLVLPFMGYAVGSGILSFALLLLGNWMGGGNHITSGCMVLAEILAGTGHYILKYYELLCKKTLSLPYSVWTAGRPELIKILIYYIFLVTALVLFYQGKKKWKLFLGSACFMFLCMGIRPVRGLEVDVLDVGQGDGIFVRTSEMSLLVDGGSQQLKSLGKNRLEPFLKSKGISCLDYIFVTHGDQDHINGIEYLLKESSIKADTLVFSCLSQEDETVQRLSQLQKKRNGKVQYMEQESFIAQKKLKLSCLYPSMEDKASNKNNQSQVLLIEYGAFKMLLTGDVEAQGEQSMLEKQRVFERLTPIDLLKVAHHGSDTSTGKEFLDCIRPKAAVVSYGAGNSYGHPSGKVLERLKKAGCSVWETNRRGAIMIRTDGTKIEIKSFLPLKEG